MEVTAVPSRRKYEWHNNSKDVWVDKDYGSRKIYSNHIMYVKIGHLSYDETFDAIGMYVIKARQVVKKLTGLEEECMFKINIPSNREGKTFNFCYVWFTSTLIFNVLSGRNPNGSQRLETMPDPSWKPLSLSQVSSNMSWADLTEMDVQPMITVQLPSLVKRLFVPYSYDVVSELMKSRADMLSISVDKLSESESSECRGTFVDMSPSFILDDDEGFQYEVVSGKVASNKVTPQMVRSLFIPYSTSRDTRYPLVSISRDLVFVTFDNTTHDGRFVLQMIRHHIFKIERDGGTPLGVQVFFSHPRSKPTRR